MTADPEYWICSVIDFSTLTQSFIHGVQTQALLEIGIWKALGVEMEIPTLDFLTGLSFT